uniref:translation initiation factor 1 n=1 Tax=Juncus bufonius TaxID=223656 RepID=UPI001F145A76|nr:translation initiation factor 1 [Juncus bufonius]ULQ66643.1 translation initiation factor 1 [Juncus bufonius]
MLGDRVLIEVLEENNQKGRIIARLLRTPTSPPPRFLEIREMRARKTSDLQTSMEQIKNDEQVKDPSELSKDTEITNTISSNSSQSSDKEERRQEKRNTNDKNSTKSDLGD